MDFMTVSEAAERWGISSRRIQTLCNEDRIYGAKKFNNSWMIPASSAKPTDARSYRYKETVSLPGETGLTSIDLFSGPGGLATGFRWAGIKPLIAVEWSDWTSRTYSKSHDADILELEEYISDAEVLAPFLEPSNKTLLIHGDINKVTNALVKEVLNKRFGVDTVDVVTGGAPCESFSMAGDRKEVDDRNVLYKNIIRIAQAVDSKMFMFENVKGLFSKRLDGKVGAMYEKICDDFELESLDNGVKFHLASRDKNTVLLKAIDYGVPQSRERLFLVGLNEKYPELEFHYPEPTHGPGRDYEYVTVSDALMDLPKVPSGTENNKYEPDSTVFDGSSSRALYLRRMRGDLSMPPEQLEFQEDSLSSHKAPGHTKKMSERIKLIQSGENMKTASMRLAAEGREDLVEAYFPKKIYAARNRRLKLDEPSFTVTSHCLDEMIHPVENRGLSPREAARLQSFPDWYQFQGPYVKFHSDPQQDQYEQIGDAIPPLLAYALGYEIVQTLSK